MLRNKLKTYISLFSSAGVGCYGFKERGFKCIATNEILEKRINIQRINNKCDYKTGYISGDISLGETQEAIINELKFWQKNHGVSDLDVLVATPPCQGMSVANHKKKDETVRNSLVISSIQLTKDLLPKFFVFENVRSFLSTACTDIDGNEKEIKEAIDFNLSGAYDIHSLIINFKDYGSNSSRTRTLVIGVRKDQTGVTPLDLFPSRESAKTLRQCIGHLTSLKSMGEVSDNDIYHASRSFDIKMLPWIENLKEGESAFSNIDPERIPHRVVDGKRLVNQSKNGDKYARWFWDRESPCIHTRNDILSSQNTVHPKDNRVFSIRELMIFMTIPESFKWVEKSEENLNNLSTADKKAFLKKEELNIRHCIGEAVPTAIFRKIAENISSFLDSNKRANFATSIIDEQELSEVKNLDLFIENNFGKTNLNSLLSVVELANSNRIDSAAFFTPAEVRYSVIKNLPRFVGKKLVRILEPSVGIGNFLPYLFLYYTHIQKVVLDVVDLDENSLRLLKALVNKIGIPSNFEVNIINADFLKWETTERYDLVVGNPPFKKLINNRTLVEEYRQDAFNKETNNLFSFFIEKSISISDYVALVVPKSLVSAPEFNLTRDLIEKSVIENIVDYGEKGFKGVKIETISFLINTKKNVKSNQVMFESWITNTKNNIIQEYLVAKDYPYWLLYRTNEFDAIASKMKFNIFKAFRDRQITKKDTLAVGNFRVLKSRNIASNKIKDIEFYDSYLDSLDGFSVGKYLNANAVLVPNLSYNPRACFLPANTITDGSVAILTLINGSRSPNEKDLEYYSTDEFEYFYKIARNFGTRSLNIDSNSVFFFGILKDNYDVSTN